MKKLLILFAGLNLMALPSFAAMNFYRAANGQIVLEATTCKDAARLADLVGIPDDPPTTQEQTPDDPPTTPQETPDDPPTTPQETPDDPPEVPADTTEVPTDSVPADPTVAAGAQTIISAIVGPDEEPPADSTISQKTQEMLEATSFDEQQDAFITFVRDVNWKTGLYITWRDYSFFRRLKMACSGVNQLTRPLRANLENYTGSLDQTISTVENEAVDEWAKAARGHSFKEMTELSMVGIAIAIEKENPFILLALDEKTYKEIVAYEPRIADLFENMYTFFKIRSVRMGTYNSNVKALIDIAKLGKGNSFDTWNIMAQYAKNMLELDRQGKLNPNTEKEVHLWRLESAMTYVEEHVRIEKRAAEMAAKDPANAQLLQKVEEGPKKKPSLNDKARSFLQKSSQAEIEHLIRKYITK